MKRWWILLALLPSVASAAPRKRVFGYLYAGASTASLRWDLLTDVAFFSEPLQADGTLPTTSWSGAGKTLVADGHAHGVRVMLTVNLFNSSTGGEIHAFLSTPQAVSAGTQAIAQAVAANGADGVNLDFEFVSGGDRALFTSFVQGLSTALHAAQPGSDVSVAMPGDAYPGYDIAALSTAADTLMIMAYDFHWGGSDPGPVAPLADSMMWGAGSQAASVTLFKSKVADPTKLVVGMPLYGYDYFATSTAVPGKKSAGTTASAVTYKTAETEAPLHGRLWDAASSTPYYLYVDAAGKQRQAFYDDEQSLGLKVDQVVASGVGGIGLWELSYAAPSFWTMLDGKLAAIPRGDAGVPPILDGGGGAPDGAVVDPRPALSRGGCSVTGAAPQPRGFAAGWLLGCALLLLRARRG